MNVSAKLDRNMRYLLTYVSFNYSVNSSGYAVSDDGAGSGLEVCRGWLSGRDLCYGLGVCLEASTHNLDEIARLGARCELRTPEYERGVPNN